MNREKKESSARKGRVLSQGPGTAAGGEGSRKQEGHREKTQRARLLAEDKEKGDRGPSGAAGAEHSLLSASHG